MAEDRSAKGRVEVVEPSPAELASARRVAEAKATVPHSHLEAEIEASDVAREELVAAAAGALRDFPRLNASYRDGRFELYERVNLAVAVESDGGLAWPTIFDADAKEPAGIAGELDELGRSARDGTITQAQLSGATFSLADLRPLGVARSSSVLRGGQAAMLSAGAAGGRLVLSLAFDARIIQAPDGAGFLARVGDALRISSRA